MEQQLKKVTKDMTMGEIIQNWPAAADIMQSYGLHCFGCHVNLFESLEQGVLGHGMSEETMNDLLNELNKMAGNGSVEMSEEKHEEQEHIHEEEPDLALTELAATKLKELIEKQGKEGYGVRVGVLKGGCAGYTYNMDFAQAQQADDQLLEMHGVRLFVDNESFKMLKGVIIDYVETLQGAGFKFENPSAKASCGCGKSFH